MIRTKYTNLILGERLRIEAIKKQQVELSCKLTEAELTLACLEESEANLPIHDTNGVVLRIGDEVDILGPVACKGVVTGFEPSYEHQILAKVLHYDHPQAYARWEVAKINPQTRATA